MKRHIILALIGLLTTGTASAAGFAVSSKDIRPGRSITNEYVLSGFGCKGGNISPALSWSNAPAGTKSFAVTFYDPDVPTGSGWWHWVIFNIPADARGLAHDAGDPKLKLAPAGSVQSRTDFGSAGYGGPCPPVGDRPHHYRFTVYALKTKTQPLDSSASGAMVGYYLHQNALATVALKAQYGRWCSEQASAKTYPKRGGGTDCGAIS